VCCNVLILFSKKLKKNSSSAGADPLEFASQYEAKLHSAEVDAVQDYISEANALTALQGEITECDDVLEAIEELLTKYQAELNSVGTDIRVLQEQSQAMNVRLRNRKALQSGLASFIERVALLPSLVTTIMQAPVSSAEFSSALVHLEAKLAFVESE